MLNVNLKIVEITIPHLLSRVLTFLSPLAEFSEFMLLKAKNLKETSAFFKVLNFYF